MGTTTTMTMSIFMIAGDLGPGMATTVVVTLIAMALGAIMIVRDIVAIMFLRLIMVDLVGVIPGQDKGETNDRALVTLNH